MSLPLSTVLTLALCATHRQLEEGRWNIRRLEREAEEAAEVHKAVQEVSKGNG